MVRSFMITISSFLSSSRLNAIRRTSERAQDHVELGLELRNSNELNAQLPFSIVKALVCGEERFRGGAAVNDARSRVR
jgi:hypothetical protein